MQRYAYLCHHAPCPNSRPLPYTHTWQNGHISTNPHILVDMNLRTRLRTRSTIPHRRVQWVGSAEKRNIGPNNCSRADCDKTSVQNGAVEVNINLGSEAEVAAIVDTHRRLNPWIICKLSVIFGLVEVMRGHGSFIVDDACGEGLISKVDSLLMPIPPSAQQV